MKIRKSKWGGLVIETARCILRCFEEKDLDSFMTYRNNEDWMKYQSFKNSTKEEYRKALLVPLNIESGIQLAIAQKNTDNLLGDLYLVKKEKTITIGYSINPIYSRKGYISEVLNALLAKLKEYYSGCEIIAMTEKENIPSKNLLLKLGFVYDGYIDKWQSEVYVYTN
jgi:[ribosomal protein S5]-alanine N-acetyltransferase